MTYTAKVNGQTVNFHQQAKEAKAAGKWQGWSTDKVAEQLAQQARQAELAAKNPDGDMLWA